MSGVKVTSVAGHPIPDWAKCYCVARHFPTYVHVLPYELPEGGMIYLCPASHHGLGVFLKVCADLGGPPKISRNNNFPLVVQRLGALIWAVEHGGLTRDQYMRMETYKRLARRLDDG